MSIWGNPVMLGGSGGGGGGDAFVGFTEPTAALGENGQYYFQLEQGSDYPALTSQPTSNANTGTAGWEFTANGNITIVGLRAKTRNSYNGQIKFANSSGTVLATADVSFVSGQWVDSMLDNPVELTSGNNYIVMIFGNSGTLLYQNNPTTVAAVTYVRGRYGSLPGTTETGTCYSCDIIIQGHGQPPYPVKTQYYKSGGVWSAV